MAEQPINPGFIDVPGVDPAPPVRRPVTGTSRPVSEAPNVRPVERKQSFLATLDKPVVIVISVLLALGLMMVYSATFDWGYQEFGSETAIFMIHLRNVAIGLVVLIVTTLIDYRIWKRLAIPILLVTFALLVGVLLFGDNTFGARRAFFNGSYQPGEMAELTIIIYMAAWLGSKNTRIRSFTQGFLPFVVLIGAAGYLVYLQPDISTAAMIAFVASVLYFLAGARWLHIGIALAVAGLAGAFILTNSGLGYAQNRVETYISGAADLTQANYHVQQAVIAFMNGGWTGVGLGEGKQKFGFLPAPHTDSIFAVIGEELGFVGATLVVLLYIVLVIRGLQIARRSPDLYSALLASGITIWIASKALLNIAVMTAVLPATGAPLPYVSFGGSSLVVLMAGAGLLLSVARINARNRTADWRNHSASVDRSGGNGRERVPSPRRSRSDAKPKARRQT
jgi:cell division protein FtsW